MYDDDSRSGLGPLIEWVLAGGIGLIAFVGVCVAVGYWLMDLPGAVIGLVLGAAVGAFYTLAMGDT
jgi:hypothetical protein